MGRENQIYLAAFLCPAKIDKGSRPEKEVRSNNYAKKFPYGNFF
jgi:hypothetical protein